MADVLPFDRRHRRLGRHLPERGDRVADKQIAMTPERARALWSAVWALEDAISVIRRMQTMPYPPSYANALLKRGMRDLAVLRELLRG